MKLSTVLVSFLFALLSFTLGASSLPVRYALHRHARRHHSRQVSAHDNYEAQQHKLEKALAHFVEYGDIDSLKFYLNGFTDGDADADADAGSSDGGDDGSGSQDQNDPAPAPKVEEKEVKPKQVSKQETKKAPQQASQQDSGSKQQGDGQHEDSEDNSNQGHDQPQPQPQPSQQTQPSQPKKEQHKHNVSPPSHSKTDSHSEPAGYAPTPDRDHTSSSSNTINGYTPPAFRTSSSPSTLSLYSSPSFTGQATYYDTGLGACGITNTDNQPIVAISKDVFEQYNPASGNPNHNSLCGRKIEINWAGKTVQAFAMDECPTCLETSLDLSPTVFKMFADKDQGVLHGISWRFI